MPPGGVAHCYVIPVQSRDGKPPVPPPSFPSTFPSTASTILAHTTGLGWPFSFPGLPTVDIVQDPAL